MRITLCRLLVNLVLAIVFDIVLLAVRYDLGRLFAECEVRGVAASGNY